MRIADQTIDLGDDIEIGRIELDEGVTLDAALAAEIEKRLRAQLAPLLEES